MEPFTKGNNSEDLVFGLVFQYIFNEREGCASGKVPSSPQGAIYLYRS